MAKICRNCNSQLMDTAAFCNHCGARVSGEVFDSEKMKKCEHCGAVLLKSARFCNNCGLPVGVPEAQDYAMRCDRCGTWLKQGTRFCNICGRRVNAVNYDFTNQPSFQGTIEPQRKPKVIPALKRSDHRVTDYDSTFNFKEEFELPPIDEIVSAQPEPELIEAEIVSVPGEEAPVSLEKPAEAPGEAAGESALVGEKPVSLEKPEDDIIYSDAPVELVPEIPEEDKAATEKPAEPDYDSDAITGEIL